MTDLWASFFANMVCMYTCGVVPSRVPVRRHGMQMYYVKF